MGNPIAKNNHTGFFCQLKVDLNVAMAVDEVVDIGVVLYIFLGEEYEVFAVLTHIGRFLAVRSLHATVFGPVKSEPHAPTGM